MRNFSSHPVMRQLSRNRREFLRDAAGLALGSTLLPSRLLARSGVAQKDRKVVVITFGGGAWLIFFDSSTVRTIVSVG